MPKPEDIRYIIWHIAAIQWGTVESIRQMHTQPEPLGRGWLDVGYHYVVTNCFPTFSSLKYQRPVPEHDGVVWDGRDLDHDGDVDEEIGAHAYGYNSRSLGIGFIGQGGIYTSKQLLAGEDLTVRLLRQYDVSINNILGHYEAGSSKACPELDMEYIRARLRSRMEV